MARREAVIETVVKGPLIKKTEHTAIRMSIISIDGDERMDFREFYRTKDSKEWKHTGKGFTLPLDVVAPALRKWLKFAKSEVENG